MQFSQKYCKLIASIFVIVLFLLTACTGKKERVSLPAPAQSSLQKSEAASTTSAQTTPFVQATGDNIENNLAPILIGNVVTNNQSSLAFLSSGNLEKLYVSPGDKVTRGQILAALSNTQETLDVKAAQIKVKQKELVLDLERKKLLRTTEQFKGGVINKASLEIQKNTYESNLLDLNEAKNELEQKKYALKMTQLKAPYDGVISQKNKSVGDFITAGAVLFQITQNTNMEILAKVPGAYFKKLKVGMILTIVSPNNKDAEGEIEIKKIVPVFDQNSRTFDLYAVVKKFEGKLNPGDFVEIHL